jgi:two-component system phosphate regulon sensor histidine kinase PhoR
MVSANGSTTSRRLLVWFGVLAGVPLAALAWLGWRLLVQEQALSVQRLREQLENTAGLVARDLDRTLAAWDDRLSDVAEGRAPALPPGALAIVVGRHGVERRDGVLLPYYPRAAAHDPVDPAIFAAAEAVEFEQHDPGRAAQEYRRLAAHPDRQIRAASLVRLARCLRAERRVTGALEVYETLAHVEGAWAAGAPAAFVARRERATLYSELGDHARAAQERDLLASAVSASTHILDAATFAFYSEATNAAAPAMHLAERLSALWPDIETQQGGPTILGAGDPPVLLLAKRISGRTVALVSPVDGIVSLEIARGVPGVIVSLEDASGRVIWGEPGPASAASVTRGGRETGMPWTLRVTAADNAGSSSRSQRNLWIAGFALMLLVVATAGGVLFHSVNRELAVARLQSDFVATVSHEFRSPLTAMRHLTEMLEEGHADTSRLPRYYRALGQETRRLQRLVESLLDFGRMEAGRRTYRMEPTTAVALARRAVEEFEETPLASRITWSAPAPGDKGTPMVSADLEAMGLVLRNLLDNALKYSPSPSKVTVSVRADRASSVIEVVDEGPGIPASEQRDIFKKFVRGAAAAANQVKGTGIGLALADHIVRAHGGSLRLHSDVGRGSRFAVVLPTVPLESEA